MIWVTGASLTNVHVHAKGQIAQQHRNMSVRVFPGGFTEDASCRWNEKQKLWFLKICFYLSGMKKRVEAVDGF